MKVKFIKKITLLVLLILFTCLVIVLIPNSSDYMGAFIDKQKTLEIVESPKVVFVGGSNLAFGLDSPLVEKTLGFPVVNTGLHAGLGLKFILDHVRQFIQPNDLVIVVPEYEILYEEAIIDYSLWCSTVLEHFPDGLRYFSPKDYIQALQGFPNFAYSKLIFRTIYRLKTGRSLSTDDYRRDGFNKYGDEVSHLGKPSWDLSEELSFEIKDFDINNAAKILNEFNSDVDRRGGKVVFMFPPIPDVRYQKNKLQIESIYRQLYSSLKMPILGMPKDYIFPLTYFYNTVYHLNTEGRLARTEKVIADLRKFQQLQISTGLK